MYLLALCSITWVRQAVGPAGWRALQVFGMNYIAYAFAVDFVRFPRHWDLKFVAAYLPFAAVSVLGPALVFTALVVRAGRTRGLSPPALPPQPRRSPWPQLMFRQDRAASDRS
jgi:hypothetical protein